MEPAGVSEGAPLTAIVAAMEEEVAPFRGRLVGARPIDVAGARVVVARLARAWVALVVTGDGERNARRGVASLLAALPVRRLIFIGVAGGLAPTLDIGALVVCEHVVAEAVDGAVDKAFDEDIDEDIDEVEGAVQAADGRLVDVAANACAAVRGVAVTARRIADTADDKRRLLALATATKHDGSSALPAVVDLESSVFASVAARAGIPWVVLRAVSDTSTESVPALLNRSRDDGGAVRRGRVVRGLLTSPLTLLPLLTLRGRVRTCAERLADALVPMLAALAARDAPESLAPSLVRGSENTGAPKEV